MKQKEIVMACICDYASQMRGKGYWTDKPDKALAGGVGLAPTNLMITTFGDILNTPWGAKGDLLMVPDMQTKVTLDLDTEKSREHFVLCDLKNLDGSAWECCPRDWLKRGLQKLQDEFGLSLKSAFEHEFHYSGANKKLGNAYGLDAMRLQGEFAHTLMNALEANGVAPEMFMPEYGEQQYEATCNASIGIESADRAIKLREITRSVARHFGEKATFSPIMQMGKVGNGVHLHYSLVDQNGNSQSYDPTKLHSMTNQMASFTAGILQTMPEFIALTASSVVSYDRLKPNRWSATYNNIANKNREASIRICPLPTIDDIDPYKRFNLEFRPADASANPYMVLGALVWSGIDGLKKNLKLPTLTEDNPEALSIDQQKALGVVRLPQSLDEALKKLEQSQLMKSSMGDLFHKAYIMHKKSELALLKGLNDDEVVSRYAQCY